MADTPKKQRPLTPQERRDRNRQEMTDAILDAARDVMREEGVAALNLQEIARRVGMRAPSLYNYFSSRMAIYEALFARGMHNYRTQLERLFDEHDPATWDVFAAGAEHFFQFAKDSPEMFQLLFERPVPGFVPSEEGLAEGRQLVAAIDRAIDRAVQHGLIRSGLSAAQTRDLFLALMHGITAQHMANEPELPVGEGRFGSLLPAALDLLKRAWGGEDTT